MGAVEQHETLTFVTADGEFSLDHERLHVSLSRAPCLSRERASYRLCFGVGFLGGAVR